MALESRCHIQRGRIEDPGKTGNREHGMAQTLYFVIAQAASRQDESGHEAQIMRLERECHVASPRY